MHWGGLPLQVAEGVHPGEIRLQRLTCTTFGIIVQTGVHSLGLVVNEVLQMSLSASVALDLFGDLDEGCGQGVMSYEVSTSTLNEVFVKLEGNSTAEQGNPLVYITEDQLPNGHVSA